MQALGSEVCASGLSVVDVASIGVSQLVHGVHVSLGQALPVFMISSTAATILVGMRPHFTKPKSSKTLTLKTYILKP